MSPRKKKLPHISFICRAVLAVFGLAVATTMHGQELSIGRHYGPPIVVRPELDHSPSQQEAYDFNSDGRDDFVYSNLDPDDFTQLATLVLWLANENGTLDMVTDEVIEGDVPAEEQGFRQHIAVDLNGDGLLDLFLESHGPERDENLPGGRNQLLLSKEGGKWVNVSDTHLPDLKDFTHGATVGDFDRDGDIDIWVNNSGAPLGDVTFSYLLHNDGQGMFMIVADNSVDWDQDRIIGRNGILPPDVNWLAGLWSDAIDADGDGDLDIALGGSQVVLDNPEPDFFNLLLVNDGTGRFSVEIANAWPWYDHPKYVPYDQNETNDWRPATHYQHSEVYDLNGDGLDDLLLHASAWDFSSSTVQMLISNGDGSFRDETHARINRGDPMPLMRDFYLRDLDGDGHADWFVWIGDNHGYLDVQINDGEGFFRPLREDWATNGLLNGPGRYLDIDGDGDTDISEGMTIHKMIEPYGAVLDGAELDDRLIGGAWDNVYRGLEGDDVLDGGLGNDQLDGGPGNDTLVGGKGADRYIFRSSDLGDDDTIEDKQGLDRIVFESGGLASIASVEQGDEGELILHFTAGGSLTVKGHFSDDDYSVERLVIGNDTYELPNYPPFQSGSFGDFLNSGPFQINYALSDAWYNRAKAGQGFFIIVFPVLEQVFLAWFTYDEERPPEDHEAIIGGVGHLWLTAQGGYEGGTATLQVYLTEGGEFDKENPVPATGDPIGTINITWNDCEHGTLSYDIPSLGLSGEIPIERVVPDNVELCEALQGE